ncbi:hotdog fold thioesterase [Pendulispora albinea]|uniref:Hotdog fold thioesterase n=1 Tax=Pendulispora albinea TaxID=2741071 RepID=A0ABZ2M210_9BACT
MMNHHLAPDLMRVPRMTPSYTLDQPIRTLHDFADRAGAAPEYADEQLMEKIGVKIVEWDPNRIVAKMPVNGNRQPHGLLHGGANAVLAETLGTIAATLYAAPNRVVLGLELSCTHHRAAVDGWVTGVCKPLHTGRNTASYEIVVSDHDGNRICTARFTCVLSERIPDVSL